jgi:hypothetical protein
VYYTENFFDCLPVSWSHHLHFEPVSTAQNDRINDIGWIEMTTSLPVLEFCYSFRANVRLLRPVASINSSNCHFALNYNKTHLIISTLSPDKWDKEEQDPAQLHGHEANNRMTEQPERSADTPPNGGSGFFDFVLFPTRKSSS